MLIAHSQAAETPRPGATLLDSVQSSGFRTTQIDQVAQCGAKQTYRMARHGRREVDGRHRVGFDCKLVQGTWKHSSDA